MFGLCVATMFRRMVAFTVKLMLLDCMKNNLHVKHVGYFDAMRRVRKTFFLKIIAFQTILQPI